MDIPVKHDSSLPIPTETLKKSRDPQPKREHGSEYLIGSAMLYLASSITCISDGKSRSAIAESLQIAKILSFMPDAGYLCQ